MTIPHEAPCPRCAKTTATTLISFRPDLVGNCCADCRTCRKLKPYVTKGEAAAFKQSLTPTTAQGEHHAAAHP
jgi:hypothetical protein